jgi:hypothetical protein
LRTHGGDSAQRPIQCQPSAKKLNSSTLEQTARDFRHSAPAGPHHGPYGKTACSCSRPQYLDHMSAEPRLGRAAGLARLGRARCFDDKPTPARLSKDSGLWPYALTLWTETSRHC